MEGGLRGHVRRVGSRILHGYDDTTVPVGLKSTANWERWVGFFSCLSLHWNIRPFSDGISTGSPSQELLVLCYLEIEYRAGPDRSQMEFSCVTRQVQFTVGVIVIMIVNVATSTARPDCQSFCRLST